MDFSIGCKQLGLTITILASWNLEIGLIRIILAQIEGSLIQDLLLCKTWIEKNSDARICEYFRTTNCKIVGSFTVDLIKYETFKKSTTNNIIILETITMIDRVLGPSWLIRPL